MIVEKKNWKAITEYVNRVETFLHFNQRIKICAADKISDDFVIHKVKFNKYDVYKTSNDNYTVFSMPYGRDLSEEFIINMITEIKLNNKCIILDEDNNIDETLSAQIEESDKEKPIKI